MPALLGKSCSLFGSFTNSPVRRPDRTDDVEQVRLPTVEAHVGEQPRLGSIDIDDDPLLPCPIEETTERSKWLAGKQIVLRIASARLPPWADQGQQESGTGSSDGATEYAQTEP
jgi:hypothetical protein